MGFWPSKALLSAVELGVFTILGGSGMSEGDIAERLGLRSRAVFDFLDGLVPDQNSRPRNPARTSATALGNQSCSAECE
jgi:hypothetical protein